MKNKIYKLWYESLIDYGIESSVVGVFNDEVLLTRVIMGNLEELASKVDKSKYDCTIVIEGLQGSLKVTPKEFQTLRPTFYNYTFFSEECEVNTVDSDGVWLRWL